MNAGEAADALGISRATLYSYVSRGLIRSTAMPGSSRERRYSRDDVIRLRNRAEERREPRKIAERALHWGVPVLESSITLIDGGRLYYRGHDVAELLGTRSVEQVASLIWTGDLNVDFSGTPLHVVSGSKSSEALPFITRAQSMLPLVATRDTLAYDFRPRGVANTGWRILNLLASVATESAELEPTIEETLQRRWLPRNPQSAELFRAALILSADHELNVSSFTARCVASAGSNPYSVVVGGLAAMEGAKHGGMSARVETMLTEIRAARDTKKALGDRLRRGEPIVGFGHPLYPNGDIRAKLLLDLVEKRCGKSAELVFVKNAAMAGEAVTGEKPTIDFALVAMARALKLEPGAAMTLFAIGRSIGWIGHAIEQYARDEIIRPRAKYVGEVPVGKTET